MACTAVVKYTLLRYGTGSMLRDSKDAEEVGDVYRKLSCLTEDEPVSADLQTGPDNVKISQKTDGLTPAELLKTCTWIQQRAIMIAPTALQ